MHFDLQRIGVCELGAARATLSGPRKAALSHGKDITYLLVKCLLSWSCFLLSSCGNGGTCWACPLCPGKPTRQLWKMSGVTWQLNLTHSCFLVCACMCRCTRVWGQGTSSDTVPQEPLTCIF